MFVQESGQISPDKEAVKDLHLCRRRDNRLVRYTLVHFAAREEIGMVAALAELHEKTLQPFPLGVPASLSPGSCALPHRQSLCLSRRDQQPARIWGSRFRV